MVEPSISIPEQKLTSIESDDSTISSIDQADTSLDQELAAEFIKNKANYKSDKKQIGKTPDGKTFEVPETHDMVRSLFDPTLRKSYGEIIICLCLASNFLIYRWLETIDATIIGFIVLYGFWRLAYNFGIGVILYYQSNHNTLVEFAKRNSLFQSSTSTVLQKLADLEIRSKMGKDYDPGTYPVEFNTWLLFRQFVDLILMQDFTTYMFLVYTCGQDSALTQSVFLNSTRIILGSLLVGFNLWVKIDAHRVVKDYAWYWGDFFFLEENELIFDGVFNLSPHPMYSIGYLGYYGFALITKSYLVLIVSLIAHSLQFVFLTWVENPHIEKIYGSDSIKHEVEEIESNESYLKPLIIFKNFNPVRISDYLTLLLVFYTVVAPFVIQPYSETWNRVFFAAAVIIKLAQSIGVSLILHKQSVSKAWTRSYLKHGLDNVSAYSNWQVLYNLSLVLSYSSLFGVVVREVLDGQYKLGSWLLLRVILGGLLVLLQLWTSYSIYESIGEFGWFYGDFFLPKLSYRQLTNSGIYRYLNDPERLLGISGIWGLTLITYSPFVFVLAMLWTAHVTIFITFVEKPHMIKVYGEQQVSRNVSGVSLTLKQLMPEKLNNTLDSFYNKTFNRVDDYIKKKRSQSETVNRRHVKPIVQHDIGTLTNGYNIEILNVDIESTVEVGQPIRVKWKAPKYHSKKDWIGLYKVVSTGSSRKHTSIPSSGRWIGVNLEGYSRPIGIVKNEIENGKDSVGGIVEFSHDLLSFEKGVYELRYHASSSHKVLAISHPFEIVVPYVKVDSENFTNSILELIQRIGEVKSVQEPINFKIIDAKFVSDLVTEATGVDIAKDVVLKLKTISNIADRIKRSKKILDDLNRE